MQWNKSQGKEICSVYEGAINFERGQVMPYLNVTFEE